MQFCQSNNQVNDLSKSFSGKVQLSLDGNAHFISETVKTVNQRRATRMDASPYAPTREAMKMGINSRNSSTVKKIDSWI